jgi:poly-D-alanine transfer protein DltD
MNIGDTIQLKALGGATKRTKNRIHNRGKSGFEVRQLPQRAKFSDNRGVEWVMLDAIDNDWSGWLPIDEIEIINNTTTN